jgi:hypothetical protein
VGGATVRDVGEKLLARVTELSNDLPRESSNLQEFVPRAALLWQEIRDWLRRSREGRSRVDDWYPWPWSGTFESINPALRITQFDKCLSVWKEVLVDRLSASDSTRPFRPPLSRAPAVVWEKNQRLPAGDATGRSRPRLSRATAVASAKKQSNYSPADQKLYTQCGKERIQTSTNSELYRWYRVRVSKGLTKNAFRHSIDRIRSYHHLPNSRAAKKMPTQFNR